MNNNIEVKNIIFNNKNAKDGSQSRLYYLCNMCGHTGHQLFEGIIMSKKKRSHVLKKISTIHNHFSEPSLKIVLVFWASKMKTYNFFWTPFENSIHFQLLPSKITTVSETPLKIVYIFSTPRLKKHNFSWTSFNFLTYALKLARGVMLDFWSRGGV